MNRRGFLASLAAVMVIDREKFDPERSLWVPGARAISIPKAIVKPPLTAKLWRMAIESAPGGSFGLINPDGMCLGMGYGWKITYQVMDEFALIHKYGCIPSEAVECAQFP